MKKYPWRCKNWNYFRSKIFLSDRPLFFLQNSISYWMFLISLGSSPKVMSKVVNQLLLLFLRQNWIRGIVPRSGWSDNKKDFLKINYSIICILTPSLWMFLFNSISPSLSSLQTNILIYKVRIHVWMRYPAKLFSQIFRLQFVWFFFKFFLFLLNSGINQSWSLYTKLGVLLAKVSLFFFFF